MFLTGYDVYDHGTWASSTQGREARGRKAGATTRARPGNGNQGHEYGTGLPPDEKRRAPRIPEDLLREPRRHAQTRNESTGEGPDRVGVLARCWLAVLGSGRLVTRCFRDGAAAGVGSSATRARTSSTARSAERTRPGIPYWIWRGAAADFPEYLPGPGGYASLGLPWEEGKEFPPGSRRRRSASRGWVQLRALPRHAVPRRAEDETPTRRARGPAATPPTSRDSSSSSPRPPTTRASTPTTSCAEIDGSTACRCSTGCSTASS